MSTLHTGYTGPMAMLPVIPLEAPKRAGLASGERYPPGDTVKPANADTLVSRRAARIRAELLVTCMTVP